MFDYNQDFHKTLTNINVIDVTTRVPGRKLMTDENVSAKQVLDHNLQWKQLQKKLNILHVSITYLKHFLNLYLIICFNLNRITTIKK